MPCDPIPRGYTPRELAKLLRVGTDRIRRWIATGQLAATNVSDAPGRPRWVILPDALERFEAGRTATPPPPKPAKRRKTSNFMDYYP